MPSTDEILNAFDALIQQFRASVVPAPPPPTLVSTAAELSAALQVGGTIEMQSGLYVGNFVISQPTTLHGPGDAVIEPLDIYAPPLQVSANDVTVRGIPIHNGAPDRETVVVGDVYATSADVQPHRVRFENVGVYAGPDGGHRAFSLHGVDITLDAVTVLGFIERGRQSQGVWINNGPGPYTIVNSYIEASGENILVGGADPRIPNCVPADILIKGNVCRKPQEWRNQPSSVANLLELKLGQRVVIEDNIFDGCWADIQSGNAIVFTVRNQDGNCPWALLDDVTFQRNRVLNVTDGYAINILGSDNERSSQQTKRITIDHNLLSGPMGFQVLNGVTEALVITNNTLPEITKKFFSFYYTPDWTPAKTPLTFARNVLKAGEYGITGDGTVEGGKIEYHATVLAWDGNVIEHHPDRALTYPAGTGNVLLPPGGLVPLLDPETFKLLIGQAGY